MVDFLATRGSMGLVLKPTVLAGEEWGEWYRLTPVQRWGQTQKLWQHYLEMGGSLDPEPDTQSPFHFSEAPRPGASHGRSGLRALRRRRV